MNSGSNPSKSDGQGKPASIDGQPITTDPADPSVVTIGAVQSYGQGLPASIDGQPVTTDPADPSAVIIGTQTLAPGGRLTLSHAVVSLGPDASLVVSYDSPAPYTIALPDTHESNDGGDPTISATLGTEVVTATAVGDNSVAIAGTTLSEGQLATVDGHVVSVASGAIVVDPTSASAHTAEASTYRSNLADPTTSTENSGSMSSQGASPGSSTTLLLSSAGSPASHWPYVSALVMVGLWLFAAVRS